MVTTDEFEFDHEDTWYLERFKQSFDDYLYLSRSYPVRFTNPRLFQAVALYFRQVYAWAGDLLDVEPFRETYQYNITTYKTLRHDFGIDNLPLASERHGSVASLVPYPKWCHILWNFLHDGSILTYIKDKRRGNRKSSILFGGVLLNFYINMPCEECVTHYKAKIASFNIETNTADPISMIYHLHNSVNLDLKREVYAWSSFEEAYSLKTQFTNFKL
ncbi:MAG: Erv1/Alr family FAD-linked sulfhydryl oxidase [Thermodesulfovibrionales bacterium]|nr:Erv1/Alr family FAD-linked sulfhydryl oxidase [Thermodesulfovibrionales bacterium]